MEKPIKFDDVADIYDYYVTTVLDIAFYLEEFKDFQGDILELMCGTGRVSIPLLETGAALTCVDYSEKMLERFRDKLAASNLQADLIEADVCQMDLGRKFDYIFIPFHSFMELVGESKQRAALERIHAHLQDNGTFLCTLHNPVVRKRLANGATVLRGKFPLPDQQVLVLRSQEELFGDLVRGKQFFTIHNRNGQSLLERQLNIQFSMIEQGYFEPLIRQAGFAVHRLYGDYNRGAYDAETSPFMIYSLVKG